jgi:hypothetical protein
MPAQPSGTKLVTAFTRGIQGQPGETTPETLEARAFVAERSQEVGAAAEQVAADAQAVDTAAADVEAKRQEVAGIRQAVDTAASDVTSKHQDVVTRSDDVVTKHTDVATKHSDITTRHADVVAKHEQVVADAGAVAASKNSVEATRQATELAAATGFIRKDTLAQLNAVSAANGAAGEVVADGANNGVYIREGGVWIIKSGSTVFGNAQQISDLRTRLSGAQAQGSSLQRIEAPQDLVPIVTDADGKIVLGVERDGTLVAKVKDVSDLNIALNGAASLSGGLVSLGGKPDISPIVVDANGKIVLGVNDKGDIVAKLKQAEESAKAISEATSGLLGVSQMEPPSTVVPFITDNNGKILLGFDRATEQPVGLFGSASSTESRLTGDAQIRHFLHYGQSLSLGANAQPPLSTTQPYANLTFTAGPRSSKAGSVGSNPDLDSLVPLFENTLSHDGGTNRGESPCSGAANTFAQLAAVSAGMVPGDNVVLASAAGHGGYTIAQLKKGAAWYQMVIDHVTAGKTLATAQGKTYECSAVTWAQGETDADNSTTQADYLAALLQLRRDLEADIRAITGQASPVWLLMSQVAYKAKTTGAPIALAQMDAVAADDKIVLVTPIYHLTFSTDNLHLNNVGSRHLGAYQGKAFHALVTENRRPKWIRPISATTIGNKATVTFDVPVKPLVLDYTNLPNTPAAGFAASDASGTLTITNVAVDPLGDRVVLTFDRSVSGGATVRYALDNAGAGYVVTGGASGNVRDSDPASSTLGGTIIPLWNACPSFSLSAINLG